MVETTTIIQLSGNPVRIHQFIQKGIKLLVHFIEIMLQSLVSPGICGKIRTVMNNTSFVRET